MRDSNPRERSQSPVCYRYTNPLSTVSDTWLLFSSNMAYYTQLSKNVKYFFEIFQKYFSARKKAVVGVGVLDDPSQKSDLDGLIFTHTELPPCGGWDVGDAIPYKWFYL